MRSRRAYRSLQYVDAAANAQPSETPLDIALIRTRARRVAHRFWRDKSGNYSIIMGLAFPSIVGLVALGTEAGLWYYKHQSMQSAADSSAVSAAVAFSVQGSTADITAQADTVSAAYGFITGSSGVSVTVNRPPQSGNYTTQIGAVEVIIQQPQARLFSALLTSAPLIILARAVALGNNGGKACVLALDANASSAGSVQGNAPVVLSNCSLADNSNNATALTFTAKKTVTISPGVYCGGINLNAGANVSYAGHNPRTAGDTCRRMDP
jgi:Flp pilus assembly protein TadG